jgi:hypothetical protein
MPPNERFLFRAGAFQRYAERQAEKVLPNYHFPASVIWLWLGLAMVAGAAIALAWSTTAPIYASGQAVVVAWPPESRTAQEAALIAFLPAQGHTQYKVGQTIWLRPDPMAKWVALPVMAVAAERLGPADVAQQFGFAAGVLAAESESFVMVTARLGPNLGSLPAVRAIGRTYAVNVQLGTRPVLAWLPGLSELLASSAEGETK